METYEGYSFYFDDIARCKQDIERLQNAYSECHRLKMENESYVDRLVLLGSSFASSIRFEDAGSIMSKIGNLASANEGHLDQILNACRSRIASLESEVASYNRMNWENGQKRAQDQMRGASGPSDIRR